MIKIYTDAGSRGNPGKSACAFLIIDNNKIIKQESKFLGIATNNEAEYNAVILALKQIEKQNIKQEIHLFSDSQLVVRQIKGEYKITKLHLQLLNNQIQSLIKGKNIKFSNLPRENKFIAKADELVNQELDKH